MRLAIIFTNGETPPSYSFILESCLISRARPLLLASLSSQTLTSSTCPSSKRRPTILQGLCTLGFDLWSWPLIFDLCLAQLKHAPSLGHVDKLRIWCTPDGDDRLLHIKRVRIAYFFIVNFSLSLQFAALEGAKKVRNGEKLFFFLFPMDELVVFHSFFIAI